MRSLGEANVSLREESRARKDDTVKLIHPSDFLRDADSRYDLVINANSMTEMSLKVASDYWNHIRCVADAFLSINHESNAFSVKQLFEEDRMFVKDWTRHAYGLRKGYAEEVFYFRK